jgi:hypothetical protein
MSLVLLIGSLVVAMLVITLLFRIVRAALGTAITLVLVILILQYGFGITVDDIWHEIASLVRGLEQAIAMNS